MTRDQFSALYAQEVSWVWQTLRRLGVPPHDLDDLTQEVFVTAWQRLDSYDDRRPLRPWLFGIAFRVASARRNRAHVSREVPDDALDVKDERPSPEDDAAAAKTRALVLKALETLRLERRAVFILHDLEGQSIPEVAAVLEVPVNTAYTRLRAARQEFAEAFRKLKGGEP